jgi:hypothetical protein
MLKAFNKFKRNLSLTSEVKPEKLKQAQPQSPGATIDVQQAPNAPPPPPPAKKWWAMKKKAPKAPTVAEEKPQWSFDFTNCTTKQNLYEINWNKVEGIQRSAEGSGGAYFTQLSTKPTHTRNISQQFMDVWRKPAPVSNANVNRKPEAIVIKGGMDSVQETIGTMLAYRLGVNASAIRLIPTQSKEGKAALTRMKKFNPEAAISIKKFKHFTIQQYLPGCSILGGDGKIAHNTEEKLKQFLTDSFTREASAHSIGRIIALDMLINMWDRIPVIWDNAGNVGNLFVHNRKVFAIDNIASAIVDEEAAKEHQKKIEDVVRATVASDRENVLQGDPLCDAVRKFVNEATSMIGFEMSDESLIKIRKGFIDAVDDWTHDKQQFLKVVDTVWNDIDDMLNKGPDEDSLDNYTSNKDFFVNNYLAMCNAYKN